MRASVKKNIIAGHRPSEIMRRACLLMSSVRERKSINAVKINGAAEVARVASLPQ